MSLFSGDRCYLFLPVRRKLMWLAICWIGGILSSTVCCIPLYLTGIFCALLLACIVIRSRKRKSALFCVVFCAFALGNGIAGNLLEMRDLPTAPGVQICGVVCAIEKPGRVYVEDVLINGESGTRRDVLVTLMAQDGEETPDVYVGQRIKGTGRLFAPEEPRNPGGMNRRYRALVRGYELSGYILPGWSAEGDARFSVSEAFRHSRERLKAHIESLFGPHAALFQGVMLGDKTEIEDDLVSAMRVTGVVHILTVSGLHLSLLAAVFSRLMRRLGLGGGASLALMTAFLAAFTGLTGCAAGTVRAMIMSVYRACAMLCGRRYDPLTALSVAALLMTIVRPLWALDVSFRFSFFVVLGIQLCAHRFSAWLDKKIAWPRLLDGVPGVVSVSACAQLAALPMQMLLYGYIPTLSLLMNLLCSLFAPVLLLGGWACTLIGAVHLPCGRLLGGMLGMIAGVFEWLNRSAAAFPYSVVRVPAPYGAEVLLFAAILALISDRIRWGHLRRGAVTIGMALMLLLYLPRLNPAPRYVQLDVGQGDAALFRRDRKAVMVDVGPADSYEALRYLRHEGLFLEAVILSHLDEDHAGALAVLLDSEIVVPGIVMPKGAMQEEESPAVEAAIEAAMSQGIPIHEVCRGDRFHCCGVLMDVLSPELDDVGSNERSLLLYARIEDADFLLTGDMPVSCEPERVPDCEVLKVAHHGSKAATSDAFLAMARPELAIISVGENHYGHPTDRVLESLRHAGSHVLRTDECGCITLWLQEDGIRVESFFSHGT